MANEQQVHAPMGLVDNASALSKKEFVNAEKGYNQRDMSEQPGTHLESPNMPNEAWFKTLLSQRNFKLSDDNREGTGEYVVVLSDYLTGADGESYFQGNVRRLSLLITGFNEKKTKDYEVEKRVKRLFRINSIRVASVSESELGQIDVDYRNETPQVQAHRDRTLTLERENQELRSKLGIGPEDENWDEDEQNIEE